MKQKSLADKSASAELSRLGTQQQELEQAVDDAKGTVLTLQKENVKRHDEYHSQLQALKATTHAHRRATWTSRQARRGLPERVGGSPQVEASCL